MTNVTTLPTPEHMLEMYQHMIETESDGAIPMLMYGTPEGAAILALAIDMPDGGMSEALPPVLDHAERELGKPTWMVLSAEAWSSPLKQLSDGTYEKDEDTPPMEVVMIVGVSADEGWASITPFTRLGNGTVNWLETSITTPLGGAADALLARVR